MKYRMPPFMLFRRIDTPDGALHVTLEGRWLPVADFSEVLLEFADPAWLTQGDGLITIRTVDATATYGVIGQGEMLGSETTVRAELLNVRPTDAAAQ
jgi:hypothetical protein